MVLGLDITSQLIQIGLSKHLSHPVRAKVECCKSCKHLSDQVRDCSALPGLYPQALQFANHYQQVASLGLGESYPSAEAQSAYSTVPADRLVNGMSNQGLITFIDI